MIAYFDGHTHTGIEVRTPEELAAVLERVEAAGAWQAVQLVVDDPVETALTVGLHEDRGAVLFATNTGQTFSKNHTPYVVPEGEEVLYQIGTAEVFYPDDAEIPRDAVMRAVNEYFDSNGQCPAILGSNE